MGGISRQIILLLVVFFALGAGSAAPFAAKAGDAADDEAEALARTVTNPIAALISLPIQNNYDQNIGANDDGYRFTTNLQPVIPFEVTEDWNLISRTVMPVIHQGDITRSSGEQTGLGDTVQSLFLSPVRPTAGGVIWGVGPVLLLPTTTDPLLGTEKWGIGPTGVALVQDGPWTYGALANHIWSYAGARDRADVNATFLQPFASYTTDDAWSYTLQSEATYSWKDEQWSVPIAAIVSKTLLVGSQAVTLSAGVRYWADSAAAGPEGLGARFTVNFLFPR